MNSAVADFHVLKKRKPLDDILFLTTILSVLTVDSLLSVRWLTTRSLGSVSKPTFPQV